MADPLATPAGVIAIVTVTIQVIRSLYDTVQSYRSQDKKVRKLRDECKALVEALQSLNTAIDSQNPILPLLEGPLSQCSNLCQEFETRLLNMSSGMPRPSFRGWKDLYFLKGDIENFTETLAGYKATINVALACLNLNMAKVNSEAIQEYQQTIQEAMVDLKSHLDDINNKLELLRGEAVTATVDQQQMLEEKASTQQCLQICEEASAFVQSVQDKYPSVMSSGSENFNPFEVQTMTRNVFDQFREKIMDNIKLMQNRIDTEAWGKSGERDAERLRLEAELRAGKQNLALCNYAADVASRQRVHTFGQVEAKDDSQQVAVSTYGDLLDVRKLIAGRNATQYIGAMRDATVQKLSGDRVRIVLHQAAEDPAEENAETSVSPSQEQGRSNPASGDGSSSGEEGQRNFGQYGLGRTLT